MRDYTTRKETFAGKAFKPIYPRRYHRRLDGAVMEPLEGAKKIDEWVSQPKELVRRVLDDEN